MSQAVLGCRNRVGRVPARAAAPAIRRARSATGAAALLVALIVFTGCAPGPRVLPLSERHSIDRQLVEYPANRDLQRFVENLTGATAFTFDDRGSTLIAQSGTDGNSVQIFGLHPDGTRFDIYPRTKRLPGPLAVLDREKFRVYGPIGGMVFYKGKVYVSHRDEDRMGRITAFDYNGNHTTIIAGLPAQGDYGVTDLAIDDRGRLFFGVGAATNSGVVGLDNLRWARRYSLVHDQPFTDLVLRGLRFDTPNPSAGLLGGAEIAVTGPYQYFNQSNQIRIPRARDGKPNSAIYSIPAVGGGPGDLTIFATGIRLPRGLAFNEFWRLYATNNGMELRGTRPVKDDPDVMLRVVKGMNGGFPDLTANLLPVDPNALQRLIDQGSPEGPRDRFQPPADMLGNSYPEISSVVDSEASGLLPPDRDALLQATFPSQSGAAKMDFVPAKGPFSEWRGNAIIALSGDRAPFATSGRKLIGPIGYKVMRVDVDTKQVRELIRNTSGTPRHMHHRSPADLLERPADVKFGPDGSMYILDMGEMEVRDGREIFKAGTGQIFRLLPTAGNLPTTQGVK